jgi:hypothetical protein
MKMKRYFFAMIAALLFWQCDSTSHDECVVAPKTDHIQLALNIEELQDTLAGFSNKQELVDFFTRKPLIRDYIFRRTQYPSDSAFINQVYARMTNPGIDTLLGETKRVFGDLSKLRTDFEEAFKNIKSFYPDFVPPKIQTVISGLDTDLLVSDTLIIVGLDYYLGTTGKYRPKTYDYLLRRYDPEDIVPSAILIFGIDGRLNKVDARDKTVLADMIAYGKSFYFTKRILPCTPDSILISYTDDEVKGARANQDLIWARFIENQVLFATSHVVKKDYLGDRPFTIQVGEKCPGRIGQWVGWQIVNKYMQSHPTVTLQELMAEDDAQKIFKESRYKPERD